MEEIAANRREYLRSVRQNLNCSRRERSRLMDTARRAVDAFLEDNPNAGPGEWTAALGTPEELARALLGSGGADTALRFQRTRVRRYRVAVLVVGVLLCLLLAFCFWFYMNKGYIQVGTIIITAEDEKDFLPTSTFAVYDYTKEED